jgi:uncharacterized membrane protein YbhN (UPF0104 family)
MSRRALADLARVAATVALLALAWRVAGGAAVLGRVAEADLAWLAVGLALTVPMQVLSAWRWCLVARALGVELDMRRALGEYYLAFLLNGVLPGGIAGDVARVWRHGRAAPGPRADGYRGPLHAVLLERAAGQVVLAAVVVAGVSVLGAALGVRVAALVGAATLAMLLAALGIVVTIGMRVGSAWSALRALASDLRRLSRPAVALGVLGLSLGVVASYLGIFLVAAWAVGTDADAVLVLVAMPVVLFAMVLPLSVGGLGLREASAAVLWPLIGHDAAAGASAALLYGLVLLVASLPGLAWLIGGRARGAPAKRPAP